MAKRILVTSGLPYANGSIHLGHLVEYILSDIHVRALKLMGEDAAYVCGDDTHGTPIELNARKRGLDPETMIKQFEVEHVADFTRFGIHFDGFYSTHHAVNRRYAEEIYTKLRAKGFIENRALEQLYCNRDQRFLPDRYVRGTCPKCKSADQYGDACEVCGTTYEPTDLIGPRCALCGETPVLKRTEHAFFILAKCKPAIERWLETRRPLQPEVRNFIESWLRDLKDWCITRDGPYFGFAVPDMPQKYFYVWLDAPIGYIAAAHRMAEARGTNPDVYWRPEAGANDTEIVHIIGKDIVYFHTIFWPAMLEVAGFALPSKVHVHGMLQVGGEKMSKSRGTFILAKTFAERLDPQYLRYYYAAKTSAKVEDIDLSFEEFTNRVNAELINKIVNLYSRVLPFVHARFAGKLAADAGAASPEAAQVRALLDEAKAAYRAIDTAKAVQRVCEIADVGNKYFQDTKPWELIKTDPSKTHAACTLVANVCLAVTIGIKPVLPELAAHTERMLGVAPVDFQTPLFQLKDHALGEAGRLLERVEQKTLEAIVEASKEASPPSAPAIDPIKAEITYDQFSQLDLRAGKILTAERVPKSEKLLKLQIDLGEGAPRQIIAGIGQAYAPEALVGKTIACVANLKPAKLMGHESRGMVLAAGLSKEDGGGKDLAVVELAPGIAPGSVVK